MLVVNLSLETQLWKCCEESCFRHCSKNSQKIHSSHKFNRSKLNGIICACNHEGLRRRGGTARSSLSTRKSCCPLLLADCPVSVYSTTGTNAVVNVTLWSLQKGILWFFLLVFLLRLQNLCWEEPMYQCLDYFDKEKGFQPNPKVQETMVDLHGDHVCSPSFQSQLVATVN